MSTKPPLEELEPDRALDVMIDLLPRLWKPAGATFHMHADDVIRARREPWLLIDPKP